MAVIYLKHDVHGAKVACGELEAQHDERHGWIRFDPTAQELVTEEVQENELGNSMIPKRRGRPPKEL